MTETDHGRREPLDPETVRRMQGLAQEVTILRPEVLTGGTTVGELAWQVGKDREAIGHRWRHRLWPRRDGSGRLDAWAWLWRPYTVTRTDGSTFATTTADLVWQVHPDHPDLLDEILDWYAGEAADCDQSVIPQAADAEMRRRLTARGFVRDTAAEADDGSWHQFNRRPLRQLAEPSLPPGFRFRTAREVGLTAATQAHIDAWHPSTFTAEGMAGVQALWPYNPDLHLLIEAPDGTLVATTIIWLDPVSRTAEFEPVGTHRGYRRRGLATALLWQGMHRARDAGADTMLVACVGAAGRPAARDLYYGVGFTPFARDVPYVKRGPSPR
jgi:GNAT superfamily N-acetyltransferase